MLDNNLDFLNKFKEETKYKRIKFFNSKFEDNIWYFSFKTERVIDFNILFQDNSLLTEKKNYKTLYTLKSLILEFFLYEDMHLNAEGTITQGLNSLLHFIGLVNTKDKDQSFAKYGLQTLTKDKIIEIFQSRLENNDLFFAYDGFEELNNFLIKNNLNKKDYEENDIMKIKEFIKNNNINLQSEVFKHRFIPIQISLKRVLLNSENETRHRTEYTGFFRKKNNLDRNSTEQVLKNFMKVILVLKKMNKIEDEDLYLPFEDDLNYVLNYEFSYKKIKHFETYPIKTIFKTFEKALDFHFKYGNDLVDTYLEFLKNLDLKIDKQHVDKKPIVEINNDTIDSMIKKSLKGKLKSMGVEKYLLDFDEGYFKNLRSNKSLYSLLKVYYGCAQFIVGSLMARRQSEINSMEINCFDEVNLQLNFRKSKSYQHSFGIRDYISLPAPEIVIEIVKNINRITKRFECKDNEKKLFFAPRAYNPFFPVKCKKTIYENLDNMFDYFEIDLIDNKRPYVRQHQLRRFFAMAFFWSKGFKSIDTLRWFLGHTNAEHVYSYIKENTQGEILNNVKSQYVSENIKDYKNIEGILKETYNIENYSLIEKDDLAEYINSMLEDNLIKIEPEFIENDEGQKFEIIIKVKNNG